MLIEKMIKNQERQLQETLKKENKSYNEIFEIFDYYLFNQHKIENKNIMISNISDLSKYLLNNIEDLKEYMAENCLKGSFEHEYINRLELIIKFLPKEIDKSILIEVKDILEEDFERISEPMTIEK